MSTPELKSERVTRTIEKLRSRIAERLPKSGLSETCAQLYAIARESDEIVEWISRPNYLMRGLIVIFVVAMFAGLVYSVGQLDFETDNMGLGEFVQMSEAALNEVILIGAGIVFLRSDLDDFQIPASWEHVARVSYATSLMRQGVLISTTEHLLSVFRGMEIDNAYVEIDNLEVPIVDGSGLPFVNLIREAGVKTYRRRRRYLRIVRELSVEAPGKLIRIVPADEFRVTCNVFFDHPSVGRQHLDLGLTAETYETEIAPARTFGFAHELDKMRDMGLIRGASLDNAICFDRDGVMNPEGLRFPDECCRHKVLDLIGDLALLSKPLLGHVIADRAGHAMHVALVSRIMADPSLYEVVTGDQVAASTEQALVS